MSTVIELKQIFTPRDHAAERAAREQRVAEHMAEYKIEQTRLRIIALLEKRGEPVPEHYIGKRRHEAGGVRQCMPSTEKRRAKWVRVKRAQRARYRREAEQ